MGMAPLYVKYRTSSGDCYVYDVGTNEIVRIGEVIYELLDAVDLLTTAEVREKFRHLGKTDVEDGLAQLGKQRSRGILGEHGPQVSARAEQVLCEDKEQSFGGFLRDHSRLLTLELSQECNLRCEYCCYGQHYPGTRRTHDKKTMSLETAKTVIKDFVSRHPKKCRVGFYGGEPLLEFELLKQIVFFTEEYAAQCGIDAEFNISTNGTLLTDEVIHFFAQHHFHVLISLDGPKEVHDRYRVFRNDRHPEERRGSYDVVMQGVKRFVELYPEYPGRGILVTLTATSDVRAIDKLLASLSSSYSTVLASVVRDVPNAPKGNETNAAFRYGCWAVRPCEGGDCRRELSPSEPNREGSGALIDLEASPEMSESHRLPDFCNWTAESAHHYKSERERFNNLLTGNSDAEQLQTSYPVSRSMFLENAKSLHRRSITRQPSPVTFTYRCFPGTTRTFCSADGKLYSCERTETGEVFRLGTANEGVDTDRAIWLSEACRLLSDCGNCVAKRVCPLCAAMLTEDKESGRLDAMACKDMCQRIVHGLPSGLAAYTAIMETCQDQAVVDQIVGETKEDEWLETLQYRVTKELFIGADVDVEELEEMS